MSQYYKVKEEFRGEPKTMLQVSVQTGILRANICRYVSELRKQDQITHIKKGICPISKFRAGFYTTDKEVSNG